jgi:hypothetical protein
MAQFYYVSIDEGMSGGPYNIYYSSSTGSDYAIQYDNNELAQNLSFKQLSVVVGGNEGVAVYVPDDATSIIVENVIGGLNIDYNINLASPIPPVTPTPTPTINLTPTPTPTPTSTEASLYDSYLANEYDCNTCTISQNNVVVQLAAGSTPNYSNFYAAAFPVGFVYQLISTTSGSGIPLNGSSQSTCNGACSL